jgi:hypothetical protein
MSRVNKVNPGKYTQRGRLTQDDAAREMAKQREAASPKRVEGSQFGLPAVAAAKAGENVKPRVKEKDDDDEEEQPRAAAKQAKTSRTTTARQAKTSR